MNRTARARTITAPVIAHPIVQRLVLELGAVVVGYVDHATGEPFTVRGWNHGARPHPELARIASRIARERVNPR